MWNSLEYCEASHIIGNPLTSMVTSLLLSQEVGGIFSRVTMTSMTSAWYYRINHFEAILVGLVLLQIMMMRYYLILPLELNKLIGDGTLLSTAVTNRKRREAIRVKEVEGGRRLIETVLTAVRRLDVDNCFLKSLCQIQKHHSSGYQLPFQVLKTISTLKRRGISHKKNKKVEEASSNNETLRADNFLFEIEEAVLSGDTGVWSNNQSFSRSDANNCEIRYNKCPMKGSDIMENLSSYFLVVNEM